MRGRAEPVAAFFLAEPEMFVHQAEDAVGAFLGFFNVEIVEETQSETGG